MARIDSTFRPAAGVTVVCSVSGGKDSAALSLWLHEQGIPHLRVFADTGWEADETYAYIKDVLEPKIGKIDRVQSKRGGMEEWTIHKGMFPSRQRRWCTDELKVKPIKAYIRALDDAGHEVLNAVGIRADESEARSRYPEKEWSKGTDCEVWRPLLKWTTQDVIDIHTSNGLPPNPLYLRGVGVQRVGCWPCINSRKSELRTIAEMDPARVTKLRILEQKVGEAARARGAPNENPPGFFQAKIPDADGTMSCWPIDKVLAWAKTAHGGRQYELFADEQDMGCARWGLCETNTPKKEGEE